MVVVVDVRGWLVSATKAGDSGGSGHGNLRGSSC